jgi:hypothetical protein
MKNKWSFFVNFKLIFLMIFGLFLNVAKSQNTLQLSGSSCNSNLKLNAYLESKATLKSWSKDGVILIGEKTPTIDCLLYGEGTYSLEFTIEGKTETITYEVIENAQGVVDFTIEPLLAAGVTILNVTQNSTEVITSWAWDFGNGEKSTSKEAKVFYKEQSTYLITLTATSETGCVYTASKLYTWTYKN